MLERRAAPFTDVDVRETADGSIHFSGYAAVFNSPTDLGPFREQVAPTAFDKTLRDKADVRFLVNHQGLPLARTKSGTLRLQTDKRGLGVDAEFDQANPKVAELTSASKRGDVDQMSFAFRTINDERDKDGLRTLTEVKLYDVSAVTFPAYDDTEGSVRDLVTEYEAEFRESVMAYASSLGLNIPDEDRAVDQSAWDGGRAMNACNSASDYASICAGVHGAGEPGQRQHYALPHHYLGRGPNADGVRNAQSRLPQTQDLANRAAATTHLANHMTTIQAQANSKLLEALEVLAAIPEDLDPETLRATIDALSHLLPPAETPEPQEHSGRPLDREAELQRLAIRRKRLALTA